MSCLFSRMVMITDNDDDDHVAMFIVMEKSLNLEFAFLFYIGARPGNKPLFSMQ